MDFVKKTASPNEHCALNNNVRLITRFYGNFKGLSVFQ